MDEKCNTLHVLADCTFIIYIYHPLWISPIKICGWLRPKNAHFQHGNNSKDRAHRQTFSNSRGLHVGP